MSSGMEESELPTLHDVTLRGVEYDWASSSCNLVIMPGASSAPSVIRLTGVTSLVVPHEEPWGPSVSINTAQFSAGVLTIEMQSGDEIQIKASQLSYVRP